MPTRETRSNFDLKEEYTDKVVEGVDQKLGPHISTAFKVFKSRMRELKQVDSRIEAIQTLKVPKALFLGNHSPRYGVATRQQLDNPMLQVRKWQRVYAKEIAKAIDDAYMVEDAQLHGAEKLRSALMAITTANSEYMKSIVPFVEQCTNEMRESRSYLELIGAASTLISGLRLMSRDLFSNLRDIASAEFHKDILRR